MSPKSQRCRPAARYKLAQGDALTFFCRFCSYEASPILGVSGLRARGLEVQQNSLNPYRTP